MDDNLSRGVVETFVHLYEQGLIYRGKRLVNWDPVLGTAVSDLEVVSEEEDGFMWEIRYPLSNPVGQLTHIVVATTRPETMLGDVAVMVHPDAERYAGVIGRMVARKSVEMGQSVSAGVDLGGGRKIKKTKNKYDLSN